MGHPGDSQHPDVQRAVADFARRCNAAGKPAGTLAANPEQAKRYAEAGFRFVALASDLGFLTGQARALLARVRGQGASGPSGAY
jgi:2-keto-3-deoxy-L-rhamnonate aldolase RhmA